MNLVIYFPEAWKSQLRLGFMGALPLPPAARGLTTEVRADKTGKKVTRWVRPDGGDATPPPAAQRQTTPAAHRDLFDQPGPKRYDAGMHTKTKEQITRALQALGFRQSGGRWFPPSKAVEEAVGLKIAGYGPQGTVRGATLDGAPVSNSAAGRIAERLGLLNLHWDEKKGQWIAGDGSAPDRLKDDFSRGLMQLAAASLETRVLASIDAPVAETPAQVADVSSSRRDVSPVHKNPTAAKRWAEDLPVGSRITVPDGRVFTRVNEEFHKWRIRQAASPDPGFGVLTQEAGGKSGGDPVGAAIHRAGGEGKTIVLETPEAR